MHAHRARACFDGIRFLPGGATVVLQGGSIVGVEAVDCHLPDGVPVTDHGDATVLPGLVDSHVHLVSDSSMGSLERAGTATDAEVDTIVAQSLRQHVRAGVTTVRDLGDCRFRALVARDRRAVGLPRLLAAGPPLTVRDGHCHFLGGEVTAATAERRVDEHAHRGVDVIKVMATGGMVTAGSDQYSVQFTTQELRAIVDRAHHHGLPVLAHAHAMAGIVQALDAGVDGIEHYSGLTDGPIGVPDEVIARTAAAGVVVCPTLGTDRAALAAMTGPNPLTEMLQRQGIDMQTFLGARRRLVARLREHGVATVAGTDGGVSPPKHHGIVALSVEEIVAAGHPLDEALACATSTAADACGLGQVTGRLAPGLSADVLVVDGDVRADVARLRDVRAVLVRGEPAVGVGRRVGQPLT